MELRTVFVLLATSAATCVVAQPGRPSDEEIFRRISESLAPMTGGCTEAYEPTLASLFWVLMQAPMPRLSHVKPASVI